MGLSLKSLGNSIKKAVGGVAKMVSLKNVVNVATGNGGGLVKELAGRTVGAFTTPQKTAVIQNSQIVQKADTYVEVKANEVSNNLAKKVGENSTTQGITSFFTKVYLQSMWTKYKTYIIVTSVALVSAVVWFVWKRKKPNTRRGR